VLRERGFSFARRTMLDALTFRPNKGEAAAPGAWAAYRQGRIVTLRQKTRLLRIAEERTDSDANSSPEAPHHEDGKHEQDGRNGKCDSECHGPPPHLGEGASPAAGSYCL
jgi:hypothetical protein